MKKFIVLFLLLVTCTIKMRAQQTFEIDQKLEECMNDSTNFTTYGMYACVDKAIDAWDVRLNNSYKKLINKLPNQDAARLRATQRKWIELIELDKTLLREFTSHQQGTMYGISHGLVVVELVKSRALILEMLEKELL